MLKILRNGLTQCSSKRGLFCSAAKFDAAYEGPGKTTVNILNENKDKLMVDGFSRVGFTLNNEMRAMGPIALFPDAVFQWNIKDTLSVTADAFVLFELLDPKPEIVFFGYGSKVDTNIKTVSVNIVKHEKLVFPKNLIIFRHLHLAKNILINVEK